MDQLKIITVADPMMGLLWETWPIHRKLETHFGEQIFFGTLMGQLVKDVYGLVDQEILSRYGKTVALNQYWVKLMQIYLQEERLTGMPIQMGTNERLFDENHTSSLPLDRGLRAIAKSNAELEDQVLYELQYDTVVENKQTNDINYLTKLAANFKIDKNKFSANYKSVNLNQEMNIMSQLKISQLPAYIVTYGDKSYVIKGLPKYSEWVDMITKISQGNLKSRKVTFNKEMVLDFIKIHPHISSLELKEAFDLSDEQEVIRILEDTDLKTKKIKKTIFYSLK
ncbi:DsbA family protein [Companilactobacillus crustorum]|uniref:DsbA family protein n=1 Tax=Companilactobacillus crustorum TaxID=392416 RepID=UPI00237DB742|nr:DsbA family protein [Companilactobacillus crustorum]WDT65072.1 DsbA family protein [Companilactobacillus crustorum]